MTLGNRIRQRRLSLGYTLDDIKRLLNERGVNISKAALSKYELDKSIPKATNLYVLSQLLDVSTDYLLKEAEYEIEWIAFRKTYKLNKKEENRIKYIAKEQVEAQLFLSDVINKYEIDSGLPIFSVKTLDDVESAAEQLRIQWKLYNWPIESITGLLEERGVFIVDVESESGFDGLSGKIDDKKPIIITIGDNTVDRKRLNIAHELGHLLLDTKDLDGEKAAFRFAAAFLIQKETVFNIIGKKRRRIDVRELEILKEEYGISIQALIRRCFDLKIINESEYRRMNIYMRSNFLHLNEPGNCYNKEIPTKVKSKLLRAISEGLTTESEVISRFPNLSREINDNEMENDWYNKTEDERNQILESASTELLSEYEDGGSLTGFEALDDIMEK